MNFNNSAARRVPPWSWPKSCNSRSKSGDWVRTFDPPIPSNGDWPKICYRACVNSWYVSFSRASYENAYSPEWIVLVNSVRLNGTLRGGDIYDLHESEMTKFVLSYLAKKQSCFSLQACLFASRNVSIDLYYEYVRVFILINYFMNGANFNISTLTVPTLQLIYNATYWYFYRCQHYHKGQLTHLP